MPITTEVLIRRDKLGYEDFMNLVSMVDPAETPLYTMCRRETELGNTEFSWTVDSYTTPKGAVGSGDGYAVQTATEVRNSQENKRRMGNYAQAFRQGYGEGWIASKLPKMPGQKSALAKGRAEAVIQLKQEIECAFASFDQTATQDTGSVSGGIMSGIFKMVDYKSASGSYTAASAFQYGMATDIHYAPTAACVTGAMATVFNLAAIKTVAKALRTAVKRNKDFVLLAGLDLREAVTGLTDPVTVNGTGSSGIAGTQVRMFTQAIADKELGVSIDVLRTDWGRWMVLPTDFIGTTTTNATGGSAGLVRADRAFISKPKNGLLLSREMLASRWGVPFETDKLAPDGASEQEVLRGHCSLVVKNPIGFGYFQLT
jgi:hypothetical protein